MGSITRFGGFYYAVWWVLLRGLVGSITCFTVDQLKQLDWSKIDLSEFIADMLAQAQASTANVVNNALPELQSQTSTITKNNAANGTQPNVPIRQ